MVEVGIPVYKARETLCDALDSLVVQTYKNFIVCLSIDGEDDDYNDIIEEYRRRGLKIRVIYGKSNGGAGAARQRILNTTQCSHIMFLDADDLFTPRAVELLFTHARAHDYDILKSSFIRELKDKEDRLMAVDENLVTWFHGKIYKVNYIKEKNLHFFPGLRTDEDAYFNAVAWNSSKNLGMISEVTYIWRDNKSSITRNRSRKEYFIDTHMNYIRGQIEALKELFRINDSVSHLLVTNTLINIYYYYMNARFYKCDEKEMNECIGSLCDETWMQIWIREINNWKTAIDSVKTGQVYEGKYICFFEENFHTWCMRLFYREM